MTNDVSTPPPCPKTNALVLQHEHYQLITIYNAEKTSLKPPQNRPHSTPKQPLFVPIHPIKRRLSAQNGPKTAPFWRLPIFKPTHFVEQVRRYINTEA